MVTGIRVPPAALPASPRRRPATDPGEPPARRRAKTVSLPAPIDPATLRPDRAAIDLIGIETCLAEGVVPLRGPQGARSIAGARPDRFAALAARLPPGRWRRLRASPAQVEAMLLSVAGAELARRAEARPPPT